MKSILDSLRFQTTYFIKARHWIAFILVTVVVVAAFSVAQFIQLDANLAEYNSQVLAYQNVGISEEEALANPGGIEKIDEGGDVVVTIEDNTLYLIKQAVGHTLLSLGDHYFLQNILESVTFLIFPIFLALYAIFMCGNEYEGKMVKIRAIKKNWGQIMLGKSLFLVIVSTIFIAAVSFFAWLTSIVQYKFVDEGIISKFANDSLKQNFNIFLNIGISIFVSIILVLICVFLTVLFKKKFVPIVLIVLYMLIIPSLGKFDLKNILLNIVKGNFPYRGNSGITSAIIQVPIEYCWIYCGVLLVLAIFFINFTSLKQSKYA